MISKGGMGAEFSLQALKELLNKSTTIKLHISENQLVINSHATRMQPACNPHEHFYVVKNYAVCEA